MAGREEALERARQRRSLSTLQEQFTDRYFPGGEAFPQEIIRVHDAAHQWSNISPTTRGEAQQQLLDLEGTAELAIRTGARGFVNSAPLGRVPTEDFLSNLDEIQGATLGQLNRLMRGADRGTSLTLDEANSPSRMQSPEISPSEHAELRKRGREFYGALGDDWLEKVGTDIASVPKQYQYSDTITDKFEFTPNGQNFIELPANTSAASIHRSGDKLEVPGGYDVPGAMPYGPKEQLMNPPLQLGVDARDYKTLAVREVQKRIDRAKASANPELGYGDARRMLDDLGMRPLRDYVEDENVTSRMFEEGKDRFSYDDTPKAMDAYMKEVAPQWVRSSSPGDYVIADDSVHMRMPRTPDASDVGAVARQLDKVRNAAGIGARATGELAGVVPLFDPEFRQAVERGDVRKAGEQLAKEYVTGAVAAPVVGAGAGVLQRVAPRAAAAVLPAVTAAGRVNPLITAASLGGSAKPSRRQQSIERKQDPGAFGAQGPSANPQLLKAEAARRRGSRWKAGPFGIPELGISEAGGLAARDASQLLDGLFPGRGRSGGSQGRRRGAARSR